MEPDLDVAWAASPPGSTARAQVVASYARRGLERAALTSRAHLVPEGLAGALVAAISWPRWPKTLHPRAAAWIEEGAPRRPRSSRRWRGTRRRGLLGHWCQVDRILFSSIIQLYYRKFE